jgi:hypothetical protein
MKHPAFVRAEALPEPLRSHFPKTAEEAQAFKPLIIHRALAARVLVVAVTRIECAWKAYIDAVPGQNHRKEFEMVASNGVTLDEEVARVLFPEFKEVLYAK